MQFVTLETIITAVMDEIEYFVPNIRKRKTLVTFCVCFIMLLAGLPFTTQGGIYLMTLFDSYSAGYSPMILALTELFVFDCIYGLTRFTREVGVMIGTTPSFIWKIMWYFVTPLLIIFPIVYGFIEYTPAQYGDYVFPGWAEAIGWTMTGSSLLCIIIYAVYFLVWGAKGSFVQRFRIAVRPAPEWGPALDKDRAAAGDDHHTQRVRQCCVYQRRLAATLYRQHDPAFGGRGYQ